jgi:branched-chain amino acid transport system permease protein
VGGFVIIVLMIIGAMALTGLLGITIERFAYRPLRNAPRMNLLLSALGVSIVLQNLVLRFQSAKIRFFYTSALIPEGMRTIEIGGTIISFMRLLVIVVSLGLMVVLTWFVKKTKMGKAMRATAQDAEAATFMGIDTNRIIMLTFLIGSSLGGAAGALVGLLFTQVDYYIGYAAGLKGFTAAVLGGIGSIPGAMLGGFLLGVVESLGTTFISSTYKDVIAFVILILVLIIRPRGILGEKEPEKV